MTLHESETVQLFIVALDMPDIHSPKDQAQLQLKSSVS
jgi:hypothetical protein